MDNITIKGIKLDGDEIFYHDYIENFVNLPEEEQKEKFIKLAVRRAKILSHANRNDRDPLDKFCLIRFNVLRGFLKRLKAKEKWGNNSNKIHKNRYKNMTEREKFERKQRKKDRMIMKKKEKIEQTKERKKRLHNTVN